MNSGPLGAIVSAAVAWTAEDELARAGHGPEELAALEAEGLVEAWNLPEGRSWTLSSLGAVWAGVRLEETIEEIPRWREGTLDVIHDRRPVHLPRHARECRLPFPELVTAPPPAPEFLLDPVAERPIVLFAERAIRIRVDRRIKGKR